MSWLAEEALRRAAMTVDRAVGAMMRPGRGAGGIPHARRLELLAEIQREYGAPELIADPDVFFPPPAPIRPALARVGPGIEDASWESGFTPWLASTRERYLANRRNHTAHARLWFGDGAGGRPAVVLIHGYGAGQWRIESRIWPLRALTRQGFDVAIALLPRHALRAAPDQGSPPPFPGSDPRLNNEGFRQAIHDLRGLIAWLRARGAPSVGVMGMSLGGYTTALLATIEPLDFAVPVIPLGSMTQFSRDHGRIGTGAQADEQFAALKAATRVVSPTARPSRVPPGRMRILAAEADRITPLHHAELLAAHFRAPLTRCRGGHILQVGLGDGFREVWRMLADLEITGGAPRAAAAAR